MKKAFKIFGVTIMIIALLAIIGVAAITVLMPNVGKASDRKITITPERIQRGEYLANSVAVCIDCHSTRDWTQYAGPLLKGTEGKGGELFDQSVGFPGSFPARNITPYNLSSWTDGEILRAITTGVNKKGDALFPVMPYHYYGKVDTEDVYSIIAYIRTLPAIKNDVPASKPDFPMNIIMHLMPQKAAFQTRPSQADTVAYGGYLVNMAGCVECHTNVDKGQIIPGQEFGGGREFSMKWGTIRSVNITPDKTGIGAWSREQFISRFKMYQNPNYHSPALAANEFNTIMPWMMYSKMTESDLASIYAYLKTVKPINNTVNKYSPKVASN